MGHRVIGEVARALQHQEGRYGDRVLELKWTWNWRGWGHFVPRMKERARLEIDTRVNNISGRAGT
eukprot:2854238-Rhodomonas_salina.4